MNGCLCRGYDTRRDETFQRVDGGEMTSVSLKLKDERPGDTALIDGALG